MTKHVRAALGLFLAGVLTLFTGSAFAQFNASLSGTVQDSTGAAIPGATVTLVNLGTQVTQTTTSTGEGSYHFGELPPAHYKLSVSAKGFKVSNFDDITIEAETPRNVDAKLATGENSETVTVDADSVPVLQTSDANISRTIGSEEIQRLPIFGADPYELLRTAPGITGDGARSGSGVSVFLPNNVVSGSNSGIYQTENAVQIAANGQRVADNNYTIDGVSVNSLEHGGAAVVTPNQESVASITVVSTSYDASDGRNSGAQIKTVTKSGTNDIHGSMFFLYDEPGLNAFNRYGGPLVGALPSRVSIKSRTYAASVGGPILKDKLFLFGSFQGYGQGNTTLTNTYVETAAYRAAVIANRPGGLSASTIADPGAAPRIRRVIASDCSGYANQSSRFVPKPINDMGPVVTQTATSGPYCQVVNGGIDIGSLTPGGASQLGNYLSAYTPTVALPSPPNPPGSVGPGPSTMVGGGFVGGGLDGIADVQQVQLFVPSHSRGNQFNGRVDYYITPRDQVSGSVFFTKLDNFTSTDGTDRPMGDVPFKPLNSAGTLIYIHTFSPTWLNELRSNITRFKDDGAADFGNTNLGIPYTYAENLPFNNIDFGVQGGNTTGAQLAQNTIEVGDQVTHSVGSHIIKFGGGVRWEQDNNNLNGGDRPDYAFEGLWNLANDAASFESQTVNPNTGGVAATQRYYRSQTYYGYLQHDWKVTPSFNFNAGFRYEVFTPYHNKGFPVFEPTLSNGPSPIVGLTLTPHNNLYGSDYGHYGPKVAFAWNPDYFGKKLVIRGGGAVAYNHLDLSLFENALQNGPGVAAYGVCCGTSLDDFSTPRDGNLILYAKGTSKSATSFPVNPAFATGTNAAGFPNGFGGTPAPQVGIYGVGSNIKNPVSYLYSLETETQLANNMSLTVGYSGSLGRHYARLVNLNFLYPATVGADTTPVNSDFTAMTDSSQAYNSLNVRIFKKYSHGLQFDATYTYSKSMDNVTNGDYADGAANQTNPANNRSEWGPSDNDLRNRVVGTVLYTTPKTHTGSKIVNETTGGWQISSIATWHSGFSWTPTTNGGVAVIQGASTVSPVRPTAYVDGAGPTTIGKSCSNDAFKSGSNFSNRGSSGTAGGENYFSQAVPSTGGAYNPIVGRNSQTGPCYRDIDVTVAKQVQFEALSHTATLRFQANMYNVFNLLQMSPFTNEGFGTSIEDMNFGKSQQADAGRSIEFLVRLNF